MITVAEYARKEGVSVQTIYRRLNKFESDELTVKRNGILYITDEGVAALSQTYENVKPDDEKDTSLEKDEKSRIYNEALIPFLREQCEFLREELSREREHSRAQAARLAEFTEQMAELVRNNQILIAAEQNRNNIGLLKLAEEISQDVSHEIKNENTIPPPKGLLSRIFNKR